MQKFPLVGCLAASWFVSACTQLPPLRDDASFPREEVFYRIKCELFRAVTLLASKQAADFRNTANIFVVSDYSASLTLREQSDRASGVVVGGFRRGAGSDFRQFDLGSNGFPGLTAGTAAMQNVEAKRLIDFADIVRYRPGTEKLYSPVNSNLARACNDEKFPYRGEQAGIAIAQELDLEKKLSPILAELRAAPTIVEQEDINVNFTVVVDAAGTISLIEPLSKIAFGAGIRQTFNENLKLTIVRKPKSNVIAIVD
jgi:hypothetical protein